MGLYKFSEDNFLSDFESNLDFISNKDSKKQANFIANSMQLLSLAANLLEESKQEKSAQALTALMLKLADFHEKEMIQNLKETGTLFPADDFIDLSDEDLADLPEFLEEEIAPHEPIVDQFYKNKELNEELSSEALDISINLRKKANLWNSYINKISSLEATKCDSCSKPILDDEDAIDVGDYSYCCVSCADKALDNGLVYDCNDTYDCNDADDVNDAKKCSGWKKAPVGSPKQRAFCKRHCGMKKKLTSKKVADDPDSCINQGLRRWKCRCSK